MAWRAESGETEGWPSGLEPLAETVVRGEQKEESPRGHTETTGGGLQEGEEQQCSDGGPAQSRERLAEEAGGFVRVDAVR